MASQLCLAHSESHSLHTSVLSHKKRLKATAVSRQDPNPPREGVGHGKSTVSRSLRVSLTPHVCSLTQKRLKATAVSRQNPNPPREGVGHGKSHSESLRLLLTQSLAHSDSRSLRVSLTPHVNPLTQKRLKATAVSRQDPNPPREGVGHGKSHTISSGQLESIRLQDLRNHSEQDQEYQQLLHLIRDGFPDHRMQPGARQM